MTAERGEQIGQNMWEQLSQEIINSGYPKELWDQVSNYAFGYLEQGRPDFDVNHTKAVVYWAYQLANNHNQQPRAEQVDANVLISSAIFHDIGYYGQFEDDPDLQAISDKKKYHMAAGAKMVKNFLKHCDNHPFSDKQVIKISYLISIHDNLDQIAKEASPEARILLEADTIGAMDVDWVEPTYTGQEALKYLKRPRTIQRYSLFGTPLALAFLPEIRGKYIKFIEERDNVTYRGPTLEELMPTQHTYHTQ